MRFVNLTSAIANSFGLSHIVYHWSTYWTEIYIFFFIFYSFHFIHIYPFYSIKFHFSIWFYFYLFYFFSYHYTFIYFAYIQNPFTLIYPIYMKSRLAILTYPLDIISTIKSRVISIYFSPRIFLNTAQEWHQQKRKTSIYR